MLTTTLLDIENQIGDQSPGTNDCLTRLRAGLAELHPDGITESTPLPYALILDVCDLEHAIWACCAAPQDNHAWRAYAFECIRQIEDLLSDPRSLAALATGERFLAGQVTEQELSDAIVSASQVHANVYLDTGKIDAATHAAAAVTFSLLPEIHWTLAVVVNAVLSACADPARRKAQHAWMKRAFLARVGSPSRFDSVWEALEMPDASSVSDAS